MQNNKKMWVLIVIAAVVTIVSSIASFQTQGQDKSILTKQNEKDSSLEQRKKEFNSQFPTALYDAPEDTDPEKKAKRKLKNKRYDDRSGSVSNDLPVDDGEENMLVTHSEPKAGLPASESEIIVVGEILEAQAYVSNNKKNVYSEFTVRLGETLKNNSTSIIQGSLITVDREGGFVEYKNGKKRLHKIAGFGMPRVGRRYVLFLKNPENTPNYEIITGYELKSDGVVNLDGFEQFTAYRGMDEVAFIKAVREAITQSSLVSPKREE